MGRGRGGKEDNRERDVHHTRTHAHTHTHTHTHTIQQNSIYDKYRRATTPRKFAAGVCVSSVYF